MSLKGVRFVFVYFLRQSSLHHVSVSGLREVCTYELWMLGRSTDVCRRAVVSTGGEVNFIN